MPEGDEAVTAERIEEIQRLVRVEEGVAGIRNEFSEFRKENREMLRGLTNLIAEMQRNYPDRQEVEDKFKLRDKVDEGLQKDLNDLKDRLDKREALENTENGTNKTVHATTVAAWIGAGTLSFVAVVQIIVSALSHGRF